MQMVSQSWLIFLLWMVSHPGSQHQKFEREGWIFQLLFILQSGAMTILVTAPEIARGVLVLSLFMLQSDAMTSWSWHQKLQEGILYKFILMFMSVLQSSTELAHVGYIYIVFCVLLIVLCFIMFLLSWDRSLGRCFLTSWEINY